jgi:PKD repeat protein
MKSQGAPPLTGPSEYGQSITIAVTPDVLPQDGASQSFITITARDAQSQPVRNLNMRTETRVQGVPVDFGVLSAKNVVTGTDGRASLMYTAPPSAAVTSDAFIVVDVVVTPVGSDYNNTIPRTAAIRLVPQGTTTPPGDLQPSFTMTPTSPADHQRVLFDASASRGSIAAYRWSFGDGESDSGRVVDHDYELPGTYIVTLTVEDQYGRTQSTTQSITVTATASRPTASFVALPNPAKVNSTVTFDATASRTTPDARIEKYTWDFGDGTFASTGGPVTTKVFTTTGVKTINLFVTDSAGRVSTVTTVNLNIIP